MLKPLLKINILLFILCLMWQVAALGGSIELGSDFYLDKTKVVQQHIELLKNRLNQSEIELTNLQQQQNQFAKLSYDHVNKQWLYWTKLDISVAKSNLESIIIELSECQQTINLLEKDTQELDNQLNVFHVFGMNVARTGVPDSKTMQAQFDYQKELLRLEKTRAVYLQKLQKTIENSLQFYNTRYMRIESLLKSQTMMQLKEQQAKSEINYQQQQTTWLHHLNSLNGQLKQLEKTKSKDKEMYAKVLNDIFYANENVNFVYLQLLIVRYKDQIQQFKVSISRSTSITLLNKVGDQTQALGKQFLRLNDLLNTRIKILENRKAFLSQQKIKNTTYLREQADLENQYKNAIVAVTALNDELVALRVTLEQALQHELSARQGLLGFGLKAWLDLGSEIVLLPTLTYQLAKSLTQATIKTFNTASGAWWFVLVLLEMIWIMLFYFFNYVLAKIVKAIPDHELGHINPKWLGLELLHKALIDIAIIANFYWFFAYSHIPAQNYRFLLNIGLVYLLFRVFINMAYLCLVDTVHDKAGHDVRLYHRLKWTILVGGLITVCTVLLHQLPLIYEIKDLFYRLFLLFVAIVSLMLLKSWDVLPGLILPHIDERRTYFIKIVRLLGLLIPFTLLTNALIGVFGFINFVLTMARYESIFLLVLIAYLIVRGILSELMEFLSKLLIRHANNGWLWMEAFLKPVDKVLRIILFLVAWSVVFFLYGWDRQSPVVERMDMLLHYHFAHVLNTPVTPITIIELGIILSLLYWVARWTREFVYRFLLSRTQDIGVRNSIAILSQYTMIVTVVLIGMRILGIDLRALTVVAGAFAFGVGLGLRDLANNFVCGFLLLLERPIRVGDTVSIGGYEGEVTHIGGRAVTVRTWDHMEVLVPNAEIFSKTFTNWTAKDEIIRTVISIKIRRIDNPKYVQDLLYQILANHMNVLNDPAPEVFLKELADDLTEFEVRYFVNLRQIKSRVSVRSEVLLSIWQTFEKNGIQHPFPQHEVHIKNLPLLAPPQGSVT